LGCSLLNFSGFNPEEGNSNTACFLLPPFQGEIKPPAMRVVVDFL
jgi:hypothetical protein